jgi:hypothetical protein
MTCFAPQNRTTGSSILTSFSDQRFYFLEYLKTIIIVHRFRVKEKAAIENPKVLLKRINLPSICQLGSEFWIMPDEADALAAKLHPKCSPGAKNEL